LIHRLGDGFPDVSSLFVKEDWSNDGQANDTSQFDSRWARLLRQLLL